MTPPDPETPTEPAIATRGHLQSRARKLAAAGIIAAGACVILLLFSLGITTKSAAKRDFIEYWAAGRQLAQHANPYDTDAIWRMERVVGWEESYAKISYSPPVALWAALPLGYLSLRWALIFWLMAQIACVSVAVWLLWILKGKPDSRWHLLGYAFGPVVASQMAGQLGNFLLLSLMLFLYFHRKRPFLAGMALAPFALKPHLVLPWAAVLVVWVIWKRVYTLIAGAAAALAASCAVSLWLDPQAWSHYRTMMAHTGVMTAYVPTLSVSARYLLAPKMVWVQMIPEICACLWALWYFWTRRDRWDFLDHGLVVLLVAQVCTPYGFITDEAILLPAFLMAFYRVMETRRSVLPLAAVGAASLVQVLAAELMNSPYYLWTTPAWLGCYLYGTRFYGKKGRDWQNMDAARIKTS